MTIKAPDPARSPDSGDAWSLPVPAVDLGDSVAPSSDAAPVSRLAPPPKPRATQPDGVAVQRPPSAPKATDGAREPPPLAIQAMRIIAIAGSMEPVAADGRLAEHAPEELAPEDLAPDSAEEVASESDDISVTVGDPTPAPAEVEAEAKPPPPPKREARPSLPLPPPAPPLGSSEPSRADEPVRAQSEPSKAQRRPWWEDMFGQDFQRAYKALPAAYIKREAAFIEEALGVAAGGVLLDLGCGAGQHAVELASRGYGVVGYDLSLYQLALAAEAAEARDQKINFLQGDMREMAFEETFDGVFCWNTTFGYFEEDKNFSVAERIFRALRPGGSFLLDIANRDYIASRQPCQLWYQGDSCVCMDDVSLDFITSRLRIKRSIILDDGAKRQCQYSMRLYSLHELGKLLHDVGFRVCEASGDITTRGTYMGSCSPRIIILAQRPE